MNTVVLDAGETVNEEATLGAQIADGFRSLAAIFEPHNELVSHALKYSVSWVLASVETRDQVAAITRAALRAGAVVTKHVSEDYAGVDVRFGPVGLHIYVPREEICERIVVGTREETKEVPDPELLAAVPKVTVTTTVEDVEWRCGPVLEAAIGGAQ